MDVNGVQGFRRRLSPNGPPSPRLAPGRERLVQDRYVFVARRRALGTGNEFGLPGTGMAQRPAVPPARAGGLLWKRGLAPSEARCLYPFPNRGPAEYGFARGEPVPIEPALGNRAQPTNPLRGSVPVAKLGFPRASGGHGGHRSAGGGLVAERASGEMARACPEPGWARRAPNAPRTLAQARRRVR